MDKSFTKVFEKYVFGFLIFILSLYIFIEIITLGYFFFKGMISIDASSSTLFFSNDESNHLLPAFFNILISIELIDTMRVYVKDNTVKTQHIITIGLMAIGRKLLVIDFSHSDYLVDFGIASLIITLSLSLYFIRRSDSFPSQPPKE